MIRIYVNKIEKRTTFEITFEIKTGYHLKLLMPETMKLLRTSRSKMTKNKNAKIDSGKQQAHDADLKAIQ